jgi:hypothetical protein
MESSKSDDLFVSTVPEGSLYQITAAHPEPTNFVFYGRGMVEMLKISGDGSFYVRGEKVEVGPDEGRKVFEGMKALLEGKGLI